jgi:hypothetical protein
MATLAKITNEETLRGYKIDVSERSIVTSLTKAAELRRLRPSCHQLETSRLVLQPYFLYCFQSVIAECNSAIQKSGPRTKRFAESLNRFSVTRPGARMLPLASNIYLELITPNRPLAYPFGPAVKNS